MWDRKKLEQRTDQVLAAYRADKASLQWVKDAGEFVPHPATWLNQDRFDRELTPAKSATSTCCKCGNPAGFGMGGRRFCQTHFRMEPRT